MWKATGWVLEGPNAPAFAALHVTVEEQECARDEGGPQDGNTSGEHHNNGVVWDTAVWWGREWVGRGKRAEKQGDGESSKNTMLEHVKLPGAQLK